MAKNINFKNIKVNVDNLLFGTNFIKGKNIKFEINKAKSSHKINYESLEIIELTIAIKIVIACIAYSCKLEKIKIPIDKLSQLILINRKNQVKAISKIMLDNENKLSKYIKFLDHNDNALKAWISKMPNVISTFIQFDDKNNAHKQFIGGSLNNNIIIKYRGSFPGEYRVGIICNDHEYTLIDVGPKNQ